MQNDNVITIETSGFEPSKYFYLKSNGIEVSAVSNGTQTAFTGIADNDVFKKTFNDDQTQLLLKAVNNRTRERNYFRLYSQFLDNEITAEEFEKEIDDHEHLYVVDTSDSPSEVELSTASKLAKHILSVDSLDDFFSLFSFSEEKAVKLLKHNAK